MNPIKVFGARVFQTTFKYCQKLIHFPIPCVKEHLEDSISLLEEKNLSHPLIVSGKSVSKTKIFSLFTEALTSSKISFDIYTDVHPDPTFEDIYSLKEFYLSHSCDSIIAVGGGSVMDASKAMGALISAPKKKIESFRGMLKVHKRPPFFIAVPTTAGTGSEATVAAVVTNEKTKDKFAINDPHLVPDVAILEDRLLEGLPKHIIANTGMDALSHALEAYIGRSNTRFTRKNAEEAIKLIQDNLYEFYQDPSLPEHRKNMLYASYLAGLSFTRAYVGYVHALAHAVGGVYHLPHGYCIAILMPYVLEAYGAKCEKKLAALADMLRLEGNTAEEKAKGFITWIRKMNTDLGIPSSFSGAISKDDILALANHAAKEANPWYPVPKVLSANELMQVLEQANGME